MSGFSFSMIFTTALVLIFKLWSSKPSMFHEISLNSWGGLTVAPSRNFWTSLLDNSLNELS